MPAIDIDDAISQAASIIADVSYLQPGISLFAQTNLWLTGMFTGSGSVFPPAVESNPRKRTCRDWLVPTQLAIGQIEGPGPTDSSLPGTAAVIDAVVRALSAVKSARSAGYITQPEEDAVVALFNVVWP